MTSLQDYKLPDGTTDWKGYRQAQIDSGERCYRCDSYIMFEGGRKLCSDCESMDDDSDEVTHEKFVRCPKCKHRMSVSDGELYQLYEDGEHDVSCDSCDYEFEVSTSVSYSFKSPELIPDEDARAEQGESTGSASVNTPNMQLAEPAVE